MVNGYFTILYFETDDIKSAIAVTTPLSATAADKIDKLRDWAKTRCRSTRDVQDPRKVLARKIEMA